ncbi:MAG: hypothetical protein ACRDGT_13575 [Candidatus Limnocylindria bacterium]
MKPDADAGLRLLLGSDGATARAVAAWDARSAAAFEDVLRQNVVLVRASERCRELGSPVPWLEAAAAIERGRIERVIASVGRIAEAMEGEGTGYVFTKALQHLPDMGHDIDLFVPGDAATVRPVLERAVGARPGRDSVVSRFAGKQPYVVGEGAIPLELHRGRLGHFGEHADLARSLFAHRRRAALAGIEVWVPSPEDHLLLQVIQRVQAHRRIRVSDVLVTLDLWRSPALDRTRVMGAARAAGILGALRWYLSAVDGLAKRGGAPGLGEAGLAEVSPSAARPSGYPVPHSVVAPAYTSAFGADLRAGDLVSAARIAAVPGLALATFIDRRRRKRAR